MKKVLIVLLAISLFAPIINYNAGKEVKKNIILSQVPSYWGNGDWDWGDNCCCGRHRSGNRLMDESGTYIGN